MFLPKKISASPLVKSILSGVVLSSCFLFISGCTLVEIKNDKRLVRHGVSIESSSLEKIKVNVTDTVWLQKNLGYPSEIIAGNNGEQYYVYLSEEKQTKEYKVFLIFRHRSTQSKPLKTVLTCKDGVVTNISSDIPVVSTENLSQL
ncbi:MAG: hypothetical protein ACRBCS_13500 [Cellvibrionaceae bacterium]